MKRKWDNKISIEVQPCAPRSSDTPQMRSHGSRAGEEATAGRPRSSCGYPGCGCGVKRMCG
ncbi:MAG: hypothetical protein KG003_00100 [Bacteroidetes bacterium]|nr:hypothetical protein [Bacteroidota bacterium]